MSRNAWQILVGSLGNASCHKLVRCISFCCALGNCKKCPEYYITMLCYSLMIYFNLISEHPKCKYENIAALEQDYGFSIAYGLGIP